VNANPVLPPDVMTGWFRLASPRAALLLGASALPLLVAWLSLTVLTRDFQASGEGLTPLVVAVFVVVGVVVARRQPGNAVGWILIGVALFGLLAQDAKLYSVLAYRTDHGGLPLGKMAVYWVASAGLLPFLIGLPVVVLFPDGRLPSRRWRAVLWAYVGLSALLMAGQFASYTGVFTEPVRLDASGNYTGAAAPTGLANLLASFAGVPLPLFWLSFVVRQIRAWRRSGGERREQLKWLMSGAALCAVGSIVDIVLSGGSGLPAQIVGGVAPLAIAALPISIGVGILKYRLYEIDRLISRTLSYLIITGLLVGVFVGIVALATQVLPFSSPVAVAASTLAAAALFNPLRKRVQHLVDRRFNRARYDAEAIVAGFTLRLRDAVDLDTVRYELLDAVGRAVEPAHASVWIRPPAPHSRA
jgi:hypothetical protein